MDDYVNFLFLFFPVAFAVMGIILIRNYYKFHETLLVPAAGVILIPLSLLWLRFTITRLRQNISFVAIQNSRHLDIETVAQFLSENFKIADIKVNKEVGRISVVTKSSAFSWGEKISLILNDSEILVNSRPRSQAPFTISRDVNNVKRIRMLIELEN